MNLNFDSDAKAVKVGGEVVEVMEVAVQSDRSYLTVAIGCTGGFHRSVYIAQSLADRFKERGISVKVRHRTLLRKKKELVAK